MRLTPAAREPKRARSEKSPRLSLHCPASSAQRFQPSQVSVVALHHVALTKEQAAGLMEETLNLRATFGKRGLLSEKALQMLGEYHFARGLVEGLMNQEKTFWQRLLLPWATLEGAKPTAGVRERRILAPGERP